MKRRLFIATPLILGLLSACLPVLPITDYTITSAAGKIQSSNCLANESIEFDWEAVRLRASVGFNTPGATVPTLRLTFHLPPGNNVRFTRAEVGVHAANGQPETRTVTTWNRTITRPSAQPNQLEQATVETMLGNAPLLGGLVTEEGVVGPRDSKVFAATIPLRGLSEKGYRVQLPTLEINGKSVTLSPISFTRRQRVEFMVPANC